MSKEADIAIISLLTEIKMALQEINSEVRLSRANTQVLVSLNLAGSTEAINQAAVTILERMQD